MSYPRAFATKANWRLASTGASSRRRNNISWMGQPGPTKILGGRDEITGYDKIPEFRDGRVGQILRKLREMVEGDSISPARDPTFVRADTVRHPQRGEIVFAAIRFHAARQKEREPEKRVGGGG